MLMPFVQKRNKKERSMSSQTPESTNSPETSDSSNSSTESNAPKAVNPFFQAVIFVGVIIAIIFHEPAKYFRKHVYSGDGGPFLLFLGVIAAIAGGIGTGYATGWLLGWNVYQWVLSGVVASVLTFTYAWPGFYMVFIKKAFEFSCDLWNLVPKADLDGHRSVGKNQWLSNTLAFLCYAASVLVAIAVFWTTMNKVVNFLDWWWFFEYIPGVVIGFILALITGALLFGAVSLFDSFLHACATGAGVLYLTSGWTESFVTSYGLGETWVNSAYVLQGVLWMAYVFPLLHLTLGNLFHFLGELIEDYEKFLELVYGKTEKGGYREFATQISAIGIGIAVGFFSLPLWGLAGISFYIGSIGLSALLGFATYLGLGKLFEHTGMTLVGVGAAAYAGFQAYTLWGANALWFGMFGQIVAAVVSALAVFFVLFPVAYAVVRVAAKPLLASWLRDPLVKFHKTVADEIFHAYSKTYEDESVAKHNDYRELFLHVVNIVATAGLTFGSYVLAGAIGFGPFLTGALVLLVAFLSYNLVGQLFLKVQNYLVGILVALGVGVFGGTIAYANQPYDFWIGMAISIPTGLVIAAAVFGAAFPLLYVFLRFLGHLVGVTHWAKPVVSGIYNFSWKRVVWMWTEFVAMYIRVYNSIKPTIESVKKSWNDTWDSVKQRNFTDKNDKK